VSAGQEEIRLFRMSAFTPLLGIKRYLLQHPEASPEEAAEALHRSDSDYAAADFATALKLFEILPAHIVFTDARLGIRAALTHLIETRQPWWCRLFPSGRQLVANGLSTDEVQTFRSAGLMDSPPDPSVVDWWYRFASQFRALEDDVRSAKGREAELLTLDRERERLTKLGVELQPRWIAIEDNSAGYDVLSFAPSEFGPINQLIEVKATTDKAPRMFLTRGEWAIALKFSDSYRFHVWKFPSKSLTVFTVDEIALHIPTAVGSGEWVQVEIQLV